MNEPPPSAVVVPGFTEREVNALPAHIREPLRLWAAGASTPDVGRCAREHGGSWVIAADPPEWARWILSTSSLTRLEHEREAERLQANLESLCGVRITNTLRRNKVGLDGATLRRTTDADFLALRGFGRGALRALREHFPYDPAPECAAR